MVAALFLRVFRRRAFLDAHVVLDFVRPTHSLLTVSHIFAFIECIHVVCLFFFGRFDKKETSTETNIVHELIPYIDANYRTLRDPAFRMVKGFSMGTLHFCDVDLLMN